MMQPQGPGGQVAEGNAASATAGPQASQEESPLSPRPADPDPAGEPPRPWWLGGALWAVVCLGIALRVEDF